MSVLSEFTWLALHRPGPHAAPAELATYYDELACVHQHLAAATTSVEERKHELALAEAAHHHALAVRDVGRT